MKLVSCLMVLWWEKCGLNFSKGALHDVSLLPTDNMRFYSLKQLSAFLLHKNE